MKFKKFLAAFLSAAMVAATVPVMHVFAAEVSTKTAFTMKADGDTGKGGIIWTRHYEFEDGSDPIDVETPKSVLEGRTFYSMGDCLDFMVKGYSDGPLNNIPYNKKTATLTNTYSLSPTASVTITVDTTNAEKQYESVIEAINKKVIFDGSESTGAILTEDEDAYVIHAKEINILNKSSRNGRASSEQNPNMGKDYENNTFTFEKGMEIRNGAQVNIKADSTSDHKITAQMTLIFNKDLTVSSGGSLSISGYKMSTDIADHIPEHPFEHSTILKFAKSGEDDDVPSMNIE